MPVFITNLVNGQIIFSNKLEVIGKISNIISGKEIILSTPFDKGAYDNSEYKILIRDDLNLHNWDIYTDISQIINPELKIKILNYEILQLKQNIEGLTINLNSLNTVINVVNELQGCFATLFRNSGNYIDNRNIPSLVNIMSDNCFINSFTSLPIPFFKSVKDKLNILIENNETNEKNL